MATGVDEDPGTVAGPLQRGLHGPDRGVVRRRQQQGPADPGRRRYRTGHRRARRRPPQLAEPPPVAGTGGFFRNRRGDGRGWGRRDGRASGGGVGCRTSRRHGKVGGLDPEPAALVRIPGHDDPAVAARAVLLPGGDRYPVGPELGERGLQGGTRLAAGGRQEAAAGQLVATAGPQQREQGAARPDPQDVRGPAVEQLFRRGGEPDRLDELLRPEPGRAGVAGRQQGPGRRGEDRDLGRPQGQVAQDRLPFLRGRGHGGGVERVRRREFPAVQALCRQPLRDLAQVVLVAAEHHLAGAVDRGDDDPPGELVLDLLDGGADGEHPAAGRAADRLRPVGDRPQAVLETEDTGDGTGDELAQAVPDQHVRLDAPVHQAVRQGGLQHVHQRLRHVGLGQLRIGLGRQPQRAQIAVEQRPQHLEGGVAAGPEQRLVLVQVPQHPVLLRPLAGEREHDLAGHVVAGAQVPAVA